MLFTYFSIEIDSGHFTHLPWDYFFGCKKLEYISMTFNRITKLPELDPETLKHLGMRNNSIRACGSLCATKLEKVAKITLDANQLESIDLRHISSYFPKLIFLNLQQNKITAIEDLRVTSPVSDNQDMAQSILLALQVSDSML